MEVKTNKVFKLGAKERMLRSAMRSKRIRRYEQRFENLATSSAKQIINLMYWFEAIPGYTDAYGELRKKLRKLEVHIKKNPKDYLAQSIHVFLTQLAIKTAMPDGENSPGVRTGLSSYASTCECCTE